MGQVWFLGTSGWDRSGFLEHQGGTGLVSLDIKVGQGWFLGTSKLETPGFFGYQNWTGPVSWDVKGGTELEGDGVLYIMYTAL